jgi:hypothetical protein
MFSEIEAVFRDGLKAKRAVQITCPKCSHGFRHYLADLQEVTTSRWPTCTRTRLRRASPARGSLNRVILTGVITRPSSLSPAPA